MKASRWTGAVFVAAAASVIAGCGGGSSGTMSGTGSGAATAGTQQVVNASGTISSFGSGIVVNGQGFGTSASTSVVDGDDDDAPSAMSAVQVGMTVDVAASASSTPMASLLRITSAVRGEVDAVDTTDSQLTVLGQTVVVTSGTSFFGTNSQGTALSAIGNVLPGNYVVVYGYLEQCPSTGTATCPAGGSEIIATLVYQPPSAGLYRVQGFITALGASAGTFSIDGLTVTTTASGGGATLCQPAGCAIAVGNFVEVRSTAAPTGTAGSTTAPLTLAAGLVRVKSQSPAFTSGASVTLEGPLSQLSTTANTLVVRGVEINAAGLASTVATLADDEIVDVTGTVGSDGSITATAITAVQRATFAVLGPVTADSATASTLTVLGQVFTVTSSTRFVDWAKGVRPFNLSNFTTVLATGDQLVVSAYPGAGGALTATRVERIPTPRQPIVGIEGVVTSDTASSGTLVIADLASLGVTVGASSTLLYPGAGRSPTQADFFAAIEPNASVAVVIGTAATTNGATTITVADAAVLSANCGWAANGPR